MVVRFFLISLFIIISFNGFTQSKFDELVERFIQQPDYKNASVGICVQDLKAH